MRLSQKVSFYCHSELVEESFTLKNRCFDFAQHDNPIQNIPFWIASLSLNTEIISSFPTLLLKELLFTQIFAFPRKSLHANISTPLFFEHLPLKWENSLL